MAEQLHTSDPLILLAEDHEDDITLVRSALIKAQIPNLLEVVRDGEQAIAYLKGEGQFADRSRYPLPGLMLLDLNMPRKDGFQVLDWIRRQPELRTLRVVVLTGSRDVYDLSRAYRLGAHSFIVKSLDSQTFTELVENIQGYWLSAGLLRSARMTADGPPQTSGPAISEEKPSPSP